MDPEQGIDKSMPWQFMVLSRFLGAVEAAEDMLPQMEEEADYWAALPASERLDQSATKNDREYHVTLIIRFGVRHVTKHA